MSEIPSKPTKRAVLITGAGGFLGSEIARQGLALGYEVRGLARGTYSELSSLGVHMFRGDLADEDVVRHAAVGCEAIFHVAAKAGAWGPTEDYERTNVIGTQRVIEACQNLEIPKLIYTSSPSVVHAGGDIEGADETLPYPDHFIADYPRTKAQAEQLVIAAQNDQLSVISLRPHLIWGPGDRHLIPRLLDRAKRGRLRYLAPEKLVDSVYIEDAARAHWNAFDHLEPKAACAGQCYFITQDDPWPIADLIEGLLDAHGIQYPRKRISPKLAYMVGGLLEWWYGLLKIETEPFMTRFIAEQLSTAHWFNIEKAKREIAYTPTRNIQSALLELKSQIKGS
jgi:2-alkyl-3-oxoalkanoate reductase